MVICFIHFHDDWVLLFCREFVVKIIIRVCARGVTSPSGQAGELLFWENYVTQKTVERVICSNVIYYLRRHKCFVVEMTDA